MPERAAAAAASHDCFDVGLLNPLGVGSQADELTGDAAWLQAMVDVELALTRGLVAAGLAPEWMNAVCAELSDAGRLDLARIAAEGQGGGNPVIPLVTHLAAAAERSRPGASDHLHVGATSQDILDTAAMLVAHRVAG
jgi:3-carboxy-cis,cis-muconate cycloisomerase